MSIPDLSIGIIRFLVSTYNIEDKTYVYKDFGNHIRKMFSQLNENNNINEIHKLIYEFDKIKIMEFCDFYSLGSDIEHFSVEFKSKLFFYTCNTLKIPDKQIENFKTQFYSHLNTPSTSPETP